MLPKAALLVLSSFSFFTLKLAPVPTLSFAGESPTQPHYAGPSRNAWDQITQLEKEIDMCAYKELESSGLTEEQCCIVLEETHTEIEELVTQYVQSKFKNPNLYCSYKEEPQKNREKAENSLKNSLLDESQFDLKKLLGAISQLVGSSCKRFTAPGAAQGIIEDYQI